MIYVCKKCDSADVEEQQWVKINTGRLSGLVDDGTKIWCCDCEKETSIKEKAICLEKE